MANNNHFELNLDTLAPTGSITRPARYVKDNTQNLALSYTVGDAVLMKVWFNASANGSESDAEYSAASWEAVAQAKATNFVNDGDFYYHVQFMDSVNNKSLIYDTEIITYDKIAPVVNSLTLSDTSSGDHVKTNDLTIDWSFAYTELHPSRYVISATDMATDIDVNSNIPASPVRGTLTFDEGAEDGTKTVTVILYDEAGNVSTAVSQSIVLDMHLDEPVLAVTNIPESGDEPVVLAENSYINYHGVRVNATDSDAGVVKYRIYEVISGQEAPAYETQTAGVLNETVDLQLSDNDGLKTIRVDVEDDAGNTNSETFAINIDSVLPTVDISSDVNVISSVEGFNTAVLTLVGTDAYAGVKGYEIWCNEERLVNANGAVPASYNLTKAIAGAAMIEGNNTIKLVVFDNADNENEDSLTLVYDNTAPSITIGALPGTSNGWYNDAFDPSVTIADARLDGYYIWVNNTEVDTDITGHTKRSYSGSTIDHQNIEGWLDLADDDECYLHIVAIDEVGNKSSDSADFKFDRTAPSLATVQFGAAAYQNTSASLSIAASDNCSELWKMQVLGDITDGTPSGQWENFSSTRSVILTTGDGNKTVSVQVKDYAGNVSTIGVATCELDTVDPVIFITLFESDGVTPKAAHSPDPNFVAHIQVGDDNAQATGNVEYKVYGDYTIGSQSAQGTVEPADYITFVPDQGQLYYTLTGVCTSNSVGYDDNKVIFVKARDNAGRVNDSSASFYYDTKAPEVSVSNIDYQVISKVHEVRYEGITATSKYADEVHFSIVPDEVIKAYKVCAYLNAEDAVLEYPASGSQEQKNTWVAAQIAVPTDGGSNHMSGSADSDATIQCLIKGVDYENALKARYSEAPTSVDGAHLLVVYVQDRAGTWSAVAEFDVVNQG